MMLSIDLDKPKYENTTTLCAIVRISDFRLCMLNQGGTLLLLFSLHLLFIPIKMQVFSGFIRIIHTHFFYSSLFFLFFQAQDHLNSHSHTRRLMSWMKLNNNMASIKEPICAHTHTHCTHRTQSVYFLKSFGVGASYPVHVYSSPSIYIIIVKVFEKRTHMILRLHFIIKNIRIHVFHVWFAHLL